MNDAHRSSEKLVCATCGEPATLSVRVDPFGKSDVMRSFCAKHAPAMSRWGAELPSSETRDELAYLRSLLYQCVSALYTYCDYAECDFDDVFMLIERIKDAGVILPGRPSRHV